MKKTQKTITKVFQGLLVLATLITMIVLGIFLWNIISNNPNEEEPPIVTKQEYNFVLEDYIYYKSDDLDFNFIIADIKVTSNVTIKLPLSTLSTSEGISLASTDNYLSELANNNYKPSKKGLSFSFNSDSKELSVTIFIPVQSKVLSELRVNSNVLPYSEIKINLNDSSKLGDITELKLEDTTIINNPNDDLSFTLEFSDYFEPSNFYTIGTDGKAMSVDISTSSKVFGIKYTVTNDTDFSYKISDAQILLDTNSFPLMNPEYLLMSTTNLASISLLDSQSGVLFFLVPSDLDVYTYPMDKVQVKLYFSNNQEMLLENAIGN
ncbi:MAG: hypothetical protein HGA35_07065 [Erysipelotrichaceae bacterium]|nr:hypothetical protein [Erysipelotrichaceae bacterium]